MLSIRELNVRIADLRPCWRTADAAAFDVDGSDLLDLLTQFDLFGTWRKDIETSLTHWSRDIYDIFEWPRGEGPVDTCKAIRTFHPEDRPLVLDCIAEAASRKTGFQFVLRMLRPDGSWKYVQANARYRINPEGREELIGTLSQFKERVRAVAVST